MLTADFPLFATRPRVPLPPFSVGREPLKGVFLLLWELQSQVATVAFVTLAAIGSPGLAIAVMLAWSLAATVVYSIARRLGVPSLLAGRRQRPAKAMRLRLVRLLWAGVTIWLAGIQPFLFCKTAGVALRRRRRCESRGLIRLAILAFGFTMYGVTTTEHLLRMAGFKGDEVLRLSLIGPFLNVPYRTFLSAAMAQIVLHVVHRL